MSDAERAAMHTQFLASVLAHPDDDTPRLIYADWLEEKGGEPERAEFIRVQVELAKYGEYRCKKRDRSRGGLPRSLLGYKVYVGDQELGETGPVGSGCSCRFCGLSDRSEELLAALGVCWLHNIPGVRPRDVPRYLTPTFRRGFVEHVAGSAADWLNLADALTKAAPIREVSLTTWPRISTGTDPLPTEWYEVTLVEHSGAKSLGKRIRKTFGSLLYADHELQNTMEANRAGDTLDVLTANWPRIKFTLPPPPTVSQRSGVLSAPVAPGETIRVGDFVYADGDGRIHRSSGRDTADAVAMETPRYGRVWVRLFGAGENVVQEITDGVAAEMGVPAPLVHPGPAELPDNMPPNLRQEMWDQIVGRYEDAPAD